MCETAISKSRTLALWGHAILNCRLSDTKLLLLYREIILCPPEFSRYLSVCLFVFLQRLADEIKSKESDKNSVVNLSQNVQSILNVCF